MAASPRPVTEIQIGGNTYRVQSSADAQELARLVAIVEARLAELSTTRRHDSRSLVLVALSLAHDLSTLEVEHATLRAQVVERLTTLVGKVDHALDHRDLNGELLSPLPEPTSTLPAVALPIHPAPVVASELAPEVASPLGPSPKLPSARRRRTTPLSSEVGES